VITSSDGKFSYKMGIIDFLTHYGTGKLIETKVNNALHGDRKEELSC